MIIQIDKKIYERLSDSEKVVVEYLSENEDKIPYISITTIAERTFTSPSTVSRAIQKIGFSGISELRYTISEKNNNKNIEPYKINNILSKSYRECTQTIDNIRITDIFRVVEYIKAASKIFIVARGTSAFVAEEFCMFLSLLGYNSRVIKDSTWLTKIDSIVSSKDLVIFFSIANTTPELAKCASLSKKQNAKIVACICERGIGLSTYSNITIIGHSENIARNGRIVADSRIPLYIISRTIIEYLAL